MSTRSLGSLHVVTALLAAALVSASLQVRVARATPPQAVNLLVNDRTGDPAGRCQGSPAVAAVNRNLLIAWEQPGAGNGLFISCAASFDSGATFVQLGPPPAPATYVFRFDPQLSANEKTGEIWLVGQVSSSSLNRVGVASIKATFVGNSVQWSTPAVITSTVSGTQATPPPALAFAADSVTGDLHVAFANYTNTSTFNHNLEYFRSLNGGANWTQLSNLSAQADSNRVSVPRLAVGPGSDVHASWEIQKPFPYSSIAWRRSTNAGLSFGPEVIVVDSIPPRRLRVGTVSGPYERHSLAVGRPGKYSGVPFISWTEGFDPAYTPLPNLATAPAFVESEPDDSSLTATPAALGGLIRGVFANGADIDVFALPLSAAENVVIFADSIGTNPVNLAILSPDGATRLASGLIASSAIPLSRTAPRTATYYLRLQEFGNPSPNIGYRLRTAQGVRGFARPRDWSDLRFARANSSGVWSTPTTLGVTPAGFPEIQTTLAYDPTGLPALDWYGFHHDADHVRSHLYLLPNLFSFSSATVAVVTDSTTDWSTVQATNPGFGTSNALIPDQTWLRFVWGDGRRGDIDVFTTGFDYRVLADGPCPGDTTAAPGQTLVLGVSVTNMNAKVSRTVGGAFETERAWHVPSASTVTIPPLSTRFVSLTLVVPDSAAAGSNHVCIAISTDEADSAIVCCRNVIVDPSLLDAGPAGPARLALALPYPNPARGTLRLAWSLPERCHVRLEVFGLDGRRVRTLADQASEAGDHSVGWDLRDRAGSLAAPGLYFCRLTTPSGTLTRRLVIAR